MSSPFKSSTNALNRPFKSPLKRALPSSSSSTQQGVVNPGTQTQRPAKDEETQSQEQDSDSDTDSPSEDESSEDSENESPTKKPRLSEQALRREYVSLQAAARKSSERLSNIQQALNIAGHPETDSELEEEIVKWRGVAQQCADRLYEKVREKVNRMGGVGVFKERERERAERWKVDDGGVESEGTEDEDEEMDSEERDERLRRRDEAREMKQERMRERDEDGDGEGQQGWLKVLENADESTGFTMKMMLRALGVDERLIGFEDGGDGCGKWV